MQVRLRRRQIMNHQPIQGVLLCRMLLVWLIGLCAGGSLAAGWSQIPLPVGWRLATAGLLTLAGSLLVLGILAVDLLRVSNRFVAPVHQVRRSLQQLARGESIPPLAVRRKDHWGELVGDVNDLADQLGLLQTERCERVS